MSITLDILFTVLTLLFALSISLFLRRQLVTRLKKTILDNWVIQILGVIVALVPLFFAGFGIPLIWQPGQIVYYWAVIKGQLGIKDVTNLSINLIETLLLIGLGIGVARTVKRLTISGLGTNRIDINLRTLIARIFYYTILLFMVFWIFSLWQISIGIPVAFVGVITVAITVAVQDILKDLVAGFYILMERPFHIGDQISTTNVLTYTGRVEDVQLRATKLRLVSGEEITIPNSLVFGSIVINNTFYGERRATLSVTVPHEDFVKGETSSQILKSVKAIESVVVKPEPVITLSNLTAKECILTVRFWIVLNQLDTVTEVMYALHALLPSAEIAVRESAGDV